VALGAILASCAQLGSGGFSGAPADLYTAVPSMADVRSLMGDNAWWASAPSFEVRPLDALTTPATERFSVSEDYLRMGTAEELFARYTVYDKTSSATTTMSDLQAAFGTSPSSPKVGDQVLYYPVSGSGGAPFITRTFVRVGQIVLTIAWARKDDNTTVAMLAKNARLFSAKLKDLSKRHSSLQPVGPTLLPPPGREITLLGSAMLPIEAFVTMSLSNLPDYALDQLHTSGINKFAYGDYALNNDTHMEVQTALITLGSKTDADAWAKFFGGAFEPDADGIYNGYIPTGGSPAAGIYQYILSAGVYGVFMTCKSSIDGEAASRECEAPVHLTALAWKVALEGG